MSADSLSVNDLSKALKKLGKRASPLDIATIQAEAHQIKQAEAHQIRQAEAQKVRQAERLSEGGEGDGLIDELVNDYSQAEAEPQNAAPQGNGNMYIVGRGQVEKGRLAALFLENRPRKLFLLFRPLLLFFECLFRIEIYIQVRAK